jgi:DNA polymerase
MPLKQTEIPALKAHLENLVDMGVGELRRTARKVPAPEPLQRAPTSGNDHADALKTIRDEIGDCKRCRLCEQRTNIVYGVGDPNAALMFVGEGPGRDEDLQGEPFVGRAGQLLTKMIEAMGFRRSDVYIANIVKCRPPDNRYPEPDEVETCMPFLLRQIEAVGPKVIITLGNLATQTLLQTKAGITALHGNFKEWNGVQVMPTYHPAFLLRNPNMKKPCWEDLKKVISLLKTLA